MRRAIIVQARMSSSRLPGKSLKRIGDKPLVHFVWKRLELLGLPVIFATSDDASDDVLADYFEQNAIYFYRGDLNNVLQRYIDTAQNFGVEEIIRVTADNPLVDIETLENSLQLFEDYDYVDGIYKDGFIKGTGFELVRLKELKSIVNPGLGEKEHVTLALRKKIDSRHSFMQLRAPEMHAMYRDKMVLTCDYKEDLELLRKIFKAYDHAVDFSLKDLISFYEENHDLFGTNLNLVR